MDLAAEYNNRAMVPDHPRIIIDWHADAQAYRAAARCDLDIVYGARARSRLDLFHPQTEDERTIVVFIHGGYWRSFDKAMFSHMARGANAHGLTVAVAGYTLCPEVTVPEIIDEIRQCFLYLHRRLTRPLVAAGHSAGGHLAACMAATGWSHYGAPRNLVRACFPISGIFDMRPLMVTPQNDDLRLDAVAAQVSSPLLWSMPNRMPLASWVGAEESFEFKRQARSLAAAWSGLGLPCSYEEVPGENHFSVPNALADPESAMTRRLVELSSP